jgi:hypothetical protein
LYKSHVLAWVHENIDQREVIKQYFTIYLRANPLSVIRLYCAQTLLFFIHTCKCIRIDFNQIDANIVESLLPEYRKEINDSEKNHRFYYTITVVDEQTSNSTCELFSKHLQKFIDNFDTEYKKKHRKFAVLSKFKVALIKLKRLSKQSQENSAKLDTLLAEAPKEEGKEVKEKPIEYVQQRHASHYDDIVSQYVTQVYHQPQPEDTKTRMRELITGEFKFITEDKDPKQEKKKVEKEVLILDHGGSARSIGSVVYTKEDKKEKKTKLMNMIEEQSSPVKEKSLLDQWQAETVPRKPNKHEPKLMTYTPVTYKARKEIERKAPDEKIRKSYMKRSKKWELIGNADDYHSDEEDEEERQYRLRQNMNATYAL